MLYDVEGYDYGEIAEMTGVSLGTVKSRIHRGRLSLRDILDRADGAVPWLSRADDGLDREPEAGDARPTIEMNTPRDLTPDHRDHDPLAIVSSAMGDLEGAERDRATQLITGCQECAALHRQIRAIAAATAALPEPPRPRDFTLTADDAARLRRPSLRRLLVDLAGPRGVIGRPIATAVTSLGVIGILLASVGGIVGPGGVFLGAAGAAQGDSVAAPGAEVSPGDAGLSPAFPEIDRSGQQPSGAPALAPSGQDTGNLNGGEGTPPAEAAAPTPPAATGDPTGLKSVRDDGVSPSASPLVAVSLALLALGLGLFVLRRAAGRLS